jgi:hypothetical protein
MKGYHESGHSPFCGILGVVAKTSTKGLKNGVGKNAKMSNSVD